MSSQRLTLLFLAANPRDTDRLALDREARAIQVELERSGHRDLFQFETRWAAEPLDLLRELRKLRPTLVHVSGHGDPSGLFFQTPDGRSQVVSTAAIGQTFGAAGASVRVVVLSACYSDVHADALLTHVDCVVGTTGAILDEAARSFAIGFYGAVGERESIAAAHRQGLAAIRLEHGPPWGARDVVAPDPDLGTSPGYPRLRVRRGVDANTLVLGTAAP